MAPIVCTWILVVTFLSGMSHAYFSGMRPPTCFPSCAPRYDSCRETIEDLKALLEITQSLRPETTVTCPTCTSTLSEELIVKLVNALIFTATQNCGFNGKGCSGVPVNNGGSGGGNTGVIGGGGNTGGLIGGGNNGIGGGSGIVIGGGNNVGGIGGNTGVIGGGGNNGGSVGGGNTIIQEGGGIITGGNIPGGGGTTVPGGGGDTGGGHTGGGHTGGGHTGGGHTGGGKNGGSGIGGPNNNDELIKLGILDGHTADLSLGGKKVLDLDVGKQSGSSNNIVQQSGGPTSTGSQGSKDPGLINAEVLPKDNELLNVGLGNTKLIKVNLGTGQDNDGSITTPVTPIASQGPLDGVTNGPVGGVTNGPVGGVTNGPVGGITNGPVGGITNGPIGGITNVPLGGVTNGPLGGVTNGVPVSNLPITPVMPTNNVGGITSPVTGVQGSSLPVKDGAVTSTTATSQAANIVPKNTDNVGGLTNTVLNQGSSVPTNSGGSTTPAVSGGSTPITNVNSGNTESDKEALNVVNVENKPTTTTNN